MHVYPSAQLHANQADEVFYRVGDKSKKMVDRMYREMEAAGLPEPEYRTVEFMLYATLKNHKWYYVKKKYKLNVNFSNIYQSITLPTVLVSLEFPYIHSHIHLAKDIHNDYGFVRYYKRFLCTEILIDMHAHN